MNIEKGLKFKIDGVGKTYVIETICRDKILDIKSPLVLHVMLNDNKAAKVLGSPIPMSSAESMIKKGYWVIEQ